MTDSAKPLWRQMFDMTEAPIRDQAQAVVESGQFSQMLMYAMEHWKSLNGQTQDAVAKLMHLSNVPAYSDLAKLTRQVGALTGKVDALAGTLEDIALCLEDMHAELARLAPAKARSQGDVE